MARKVTGGMIASAGGVFAAHNQGRVRARYQGVDGPGFFVEFLDNKALGQFEAALDDGVVKIERATLAAAIATGDDLKLRLRRFFDGVFQGSGPTGNTHRRASNAMVQSVTYNTVNGEPGFAYVLYSKLGRGKGPSSFIDYLLAHLHGQTIQARSWFRLPVSDDAKALQRAGGRFSVGSFPAAGTKVFYREAQDDPDKLFLLRQHSRTGKTQLLEVLLKSVKIKPKLGGLDVVLSEAEAIFERHADAAWARD